MGEFESEIETRRKIIEDIVKGEEVKDTEAIQIHKEGKIAENALQDNSSKRR